MTISQAPGTSTLQAVVTELIMHCSTRMIALNGGDTVSVADQALMDADRLLFGGLSDVLKSASRRGLFDGDIGPAADLLRQMAAHLGNDTRFAELSAEASVILQAYMTAEPAGRTGATSVRTAPISEGETVKL